MLNTVQMTWMLLQQDAIWETQQQTAALLAQAAAAATRPSGAPKGGGTGGATGGATGGVARVASHSTLGSIASGRSTPVGASPSPDPSVSSRRSRVPNGASPSSLRPSPSEDGRSVANRCIK